MPRARVLHTALAEADLVIVLTDHVEYDAETLTRHSRLLFDTRGRTRFAEDHRPPNASNCCERMDVRNSPEISLAPPEIIRWT